MQFKILKKDRQSKARIGLLKTTHGEIRTPFFMPIATKGSIKGVAPGELKDLEAQIILANTYHLYLRPGHKLIEKLGGLHKFMNWSGPVLTDSGGFQVFSLAKINKVLDQGVDFQCDIDGGHCFLSPEKSIEIQMSLGSDIMMVLDDVVPYPCDHRRAKEAVERTTNWAQRSKDYWAHHPASSLRKESPHLRWVPPYSHSAGRARPMLFGIVQGSTYKDLRLKSAKDIVKLNFDGYAIGGLAVGEPKEEMWEVLDYLIPELPEDRPRYLMGLGKPEDIVEAVKRGIDMFDCVIPTRNARHGALFVWTKSNAIRGKFYHILKIKNQEFAEDKESIDKTCDCYTCQNFSRAYLRHLFMTEDPLGQRLATIHNLRFYLRLMEKIRKEIEKS